jgi:5-methylcytosine-specific restriction protein A
MSKDNTYRKLICCQRWRTLRNQYLAEHPECELCLSQGIHRAANCVHHRSPVESAPTERLAEQLAYSWSNLQALCLHCHKGIHEAERSHSREAHRQRQADALSRWKERHTSKTGGVFRSEGGITPKSTVTQES